MGGPHQLNHLQFHQLLGAKAGHLVQNIRIGAVFISPRSTIISSVTIGRSVQVENSTRPTEDR